MTSKIKVDNINKVSDDTNIIKKCGSTTTVGSGSGTIVVDGSTVTLGRCGGTVALASGASQSGFGRTGTVDWQTGSIKTSTFTAVSGEGYFCNTSGGAFTMTLPASPSAGDIVAFKDYANTFDTNNLTIGRNGSNISGEAEDATIEVEGQSVTLIYGDATKGWQGVYAATEADVPKPNFMVATGGTVTCCGNFKIHTFTGPGTFQVTQLSGTPACNAMDYLVVAGGGGAQCGGGGAGGFRSSNDTCMPAPQTSPLANATGLTATITSYPITIGAGGAYASGNNTTTNGGNSIFSTITSTGGGRTRPSPGPSPGGSGGGAYNSATDGGSGGSGNTPPVSPPQGNDGGDCPSPSSSSAGGGGAAGVGGNAPGPRAGGEGSYMVSAGFAGCNGTTGPVSGARYFAGGGGGGADAGGGFSNTTAASGGGAVGIANSGASSRPGPQCGVTNTGGGGGGAWFGVSGSGGSGIVIIRYKYQ